MKLNVGFFAAILLSTTVRTTTSLGVTDKADCEVYPDPHFQTWQGKHYDYHGECDLVLIQNPAFSPGGLHLHIRTRIMSGGGWSGITNAALRIANDILEVNHNGHYYVDGILDPSPPLTIGTYDVSIISSGSSKVFKVKLNMGQYVLVKHWNNHLRVDVSAIGYDFLESIGLCGTWKTAGLIARDGGSVLTNGNDFGEEWQVRNTEPSLFQPARGSSPQYPQACSSAPDVRDKFTDKMVVNKAIDECKNIQGPKNENCVFDVVVTGDVKWAREYLRN